MQVRIYAVRTECGWNTGMTLDWRVDASYWLSEDGRKANGTKLVILQQAVSIQVGLSVLEQFLFVEEMDEWGKRKWTQYFAELLIPHRETLEESAQLLLAEEHLDVLIVEPPYSEPSSNTYVKEHREQGYLVAERAAIYMGEEERAIGNITDVHSQQQEERTGAQRAPLSLFADAWQFADVMCGRLLLDDEIVQLLRHKGWERLVPMRHVLIQFGWLQGWLEVRSSIQWRRESDAHDRKRRKGIWWLGTSSLWPFKDKSTAAYCGRCGSTDGLNASSCASCGSKRCLTCTQCLNLGRSRSCALLIRGVLQQEADSRQQAAPVEERLKKWSLAPAQEAASTQALQYIQTLREKVRRNRRGKLPQGKGAFLLWAVTGAGKTEMIFPLIEDTLLHGGRVLVATPRRDVVLELKPRVEKAFPVQKVVTLYGGSPERWNEGMLTLATTHQLLRFAEAFELVIIDELDAFPYHNDPMLHRAANRVCRPGGVFVYLSATPPESMQRDVRRGRMAHAKVPVRFHRHPLPVPAHITMPAVEQCLTRRSLPAPLMKRMIHSVERGAQVFIFVARIRQVEPMVRLLSNQLPGIPVGGTSAVDELRSDKVMRFRERNIRVLVTTTILERGVTVPKSDVYILDAHDRLFDASSLVQMAGRAGRSKDDPAGSVVFGSAQWNEAQRKAVYQIREMNRIARRNGYLLSDEERRKQVG